MRQTTVSDKIHVRQCRYVECGKTFEVSGLSARNQRYCSKQCQADKARGGPKLPRAPQKQTCVVCSEIFWAAFSHKYCGPACSALARKAHRVGTTPAVVRAETHCGGCRARLADLPSRLIHIDHDHVSGSYRGVLCHNCNLALGHAQDSREILMGLIEYLERHEKQLCNWNQGYGRRGDALEAGSSAAGEVSFGLGEANFERSH